MARAGDLWKRKKNMLAYLFLSWEKNFETKRKQTNDERIFLKSRASSYKYLSIKSNRIYMLHL